jgi:hypothetical protein
MSALFDFSSLLVVILLFICATTFTRSLYPTIFNSPDAQATGRREHNGLTGLCWKASRIGERISPYVAGACVLMAFHILFLK